MNDILLQGSSFRSNPGNAELSHSFENNRENANAQCFGLHILYGGTYAELQFCTIQMTVIFGPLVRGKCQSPEVRRKAVLQNKHWIPPCSAVYRPAYMRRPHPHCRGTRPARGTVFVTCSDGFRANKKVS